MKERNVQENQSFSIIKNTAKFTNQKIVFFDRDDTIADGKNDFLDKQKTKPLLQERTSYGVCGIISRGSLNSLADDPFHKEKLLPNGIKFQPALYSKILDAQIVKDENFFPNADERKKINDVIDKHSRKHFTADMKIGEISFKLNQNAFKENPVGLIHLQKIKELFFLLSQLECGIRDIDKIIEENNLKEIGIESVSFPKNFTLKNAKDIVMVDDDFNICKTMEKFGLTAIHAVSDSLIEQKKAKVQSIKDVLTREIKVQELDNNIDINNFTPTDKNTIYYTENNGEVSYITKETFDNYNQIKSKNPTANPKKISAISIKNSTDNIENLIKADALKGNKIDPELLMDIQSPNIKMKTSYIHLKDELFKLFKKDMGADDEAIFLMNELDHSIEKCQRDLRRLIDDIKENVSYDTSNLPSHVVNKINEFLSKDKVSLQEVEEFINFLSNENAQLKTLGRANNVTQEIKGDIEKWQTSLNEIKANIAAMPQQLGALCDKANKLIQQMESHKDVYLSELEKIAPVEKDLNKLTQSKDTNYQSLLNLKAFILEKDWKVGKLGGIKISPTDQRKVPHGVGEILRKIQNALKETDPKKHTSALNEIRTLGKRKANESSITDILKVRDKSTISFYETIGKWDATSSHTQKVRKEVDNIKNKGKEVEMEPLLQKNNFDPN